MHTSQSNNNNISTLTDSLVTVTIVTVYTFHSLTRYLAQQQYSYYGTGIKEWVNEPAVWFG